MATEESCISDPETDDVELMRLTADGNHEAFACLIRRHQSSLLNFFDRMGVHIHAEDMAQETFVRVYNHRKRYRPTAKFTTFLYTVARHVWVDWGRKERRFKVYEEDIRNGTSGVSDGGMAETRLRLDLQTALSRLPEALRIVIVLGVLQELRYRDIADALDIPVGTVKSRMFTALKRLRDLLEGEDHAR